MAKFQEFPEYAQNQVATQLGTLLPRTTFGVSLGSPDADPQVCESIDMLLLSRIDNENIRLADAALPMGRWYHQICNGTTPVGYASSVDSSGLGKWTVTETSGANALPTRVAAAIEDIESKYSDDSIIVSMIIAPIYQLYALWARGPGVSSVIVLSRGSELGEPLVERRELPFLSESDFVRELMQSSKLGGLTI